MRQVASVGRARFSTEKVRAPEMVRDYNIKMKKGILKMG